MHLYDWLNNPEDLEKFPIWAIWILHVYKIELV